MYCWKNNGVKKIKNHPAVELNSQIDQLSFYLNVDML